ncbi:MAG: AI-2E family transporter [Ruminococcus sp.]|nr:AI-2E family transporter [Ruminococcus sp.]
MENKNKNNKYPYMQSTFTKSILFCGVILIIVFMAFLRFNVVAIFVANALSVMRPLFIGAIVAIILNRPVNILDRLFRIPFRKEYEHKLADYNEKKSKSKFYNKKEPKMNTWLPFTIAIILSYVLALGILTCVVLFVIPQFIESINLFASNFQTYYAQVYDWVVNISSKIDVSSIEFDKILSQAQTQIQKGLEFIPAFISETVKATFSIVKGFVDFVLGIVFSVYILADKRNLKKNATILTNKLCSESWSARVIKWCKLTFDSFSNFFSGQLLEAMILGLLCFIGMRIFGFEYPVLISVIVGVTNIIPIVGPWVGSIPCILILFLAEPISAIWWIIYFIVLQQVEANIIYPRVVGTSVGLPGIWVLFAVLVGGGLMGVFGMLIGVPILSVIYTLTMEFINADREKKKSVIDERLIEI